jgi:hypothetical protein
MEAMRNSWTDERLDDGFDRVRGDISVVRGEVGSLRKELHQEVGSLRGEIGSLRDELHQEIGSLRKEMYEEIGSLRKEMHQDFVALQHTLLQIGGGMILALIGIIVTQL